MELNVARPVGRIFRVLDRLLGLSEWREQAPHLFDSALAHRAVTETIEAEAA